MVLVAVGFGMSEDRIGANTQIGEQGPDQVDGLPVAPEMPVSQSQEMDPGWMNAKLSCCSCSLVATDRSDARVYIVACDDDSNFAAGSAQLCARSTRPQLDIVGVGSKENRNCHVLDHMDSLARNLS